MTDPRPEQTSGGGARKAVRLFAICAVILLAAIGLFALFMRLAFVSAGPHVVFAMTAGVVATILLGAGLMALAFYSDDSGTDDEQF